MALFGFTLNSSCISVDAYPWLYTQPNGIRFGIYFRRAATGTLAARIRRP